MAPTKTTAFAVCGGVSVETVVTSAGRRRNTAKATKWGAVVGLADSLYADLLWDCGGANVENATVAAGTAFPTQEIPSDDFSDVFGGPPNFATISSKLSGMLVTKLAHSNEMLPSDPSARTSVGFDDPPAQTQLSLVQETLHNLTSSPTSAKFVKVRPVTEVNFSSHISYSDSDNKHSCQQRGNNANGAKEFSTAVLSKAFSPVRPANILVRQKESSGSHGSKELKRLSFLKHLKGDQTSMEENVEEFIEVPGKEQEANLATVHEKMAQFLHVSHHRKQQKSGQRSQLSKVRMQKPTLNLENDSFEELWVTIRDVQCATEPCQFPPPSRPPPKLRPNAACTPKNIDEAASRRSMTSSFTPELSMKDFSDSRNIKDAVEIAEAKIRTVLEAREKAKLMVDKKLREKRRAQQLKDRVARDAKCGKEEDGKGNTKPRHKFCDMDKLQTEQLQQRDIASQYLKKGTQGLPNESVLSVQQRVAELRFSPSICEEPLEISGHTAKTEVNLTTIDIEPNLLARCFWLETNRVYHKQSLCGASSEKIAEEVMNEPREQQQDCLSNSWGCTERKEFSKSNLEEVNPVPSTHDAAAVFSGIEPSSTNVQEITGESLERQLARWDRDCRTAARMEKALEEKRQRDLQRQEEQAERQRAADILDDEIRVWAAGKEGNLEALLCTLHLVLWPECGWKEILPADLSTEDVVKKAYRRATLFVHPDKVQQRGATVAQKYVAEKVFDLLREALAIYK